jgi:hypothetical protein
VGDGGDPMRHPFLIRAQERSRSRHVNRVTGTGLIAPHRTVSRDRATDDGVTHQLVRPRHVATDQERSGFVRERIHALIELIQPVIIRPLGQCEGEQAEARLAPHRGDIAKSAGQRFVSNVTGSVGVAEEVNAFHQKVGGD